MQNSSNNNNSKVNIAIKWSKHNINKNKFKKGKIKAITSIKTSQSNNNVK